MRGPKAPRRLPGPRFLILEFGGGLYQKMVGLRNRVLRAPLGLVLKPEDLEKEQGDLHLAAVENEEVLACCILTDLGGGLAKLRQMAVGPETRGSGLGRSLLNFAEITAVGHGFSKIELHSRKTVTGFYLKSGYRITGGEFIEVGLPHLPMEKDLPPIR